MHELLTPSEMCFADKLTIKNGLSGITLMENAGHAIASVVQKKFPSAGKILVICGTGNNGGDGFVAARLLQDAGLTVKFYICGDITTIRGDAELALAKLSKDNLLTNIADLQEYDLLIDALLGAGLDRDVTGSIADLINLINESGKPVVSIDLPSGIDGASGLVRGAAIKANASVTFFRYKPGHFLMPGREYCGELHLHQIGIESSVLEKIDVLAVRNIMDIWVGQFPRINQSTHKYNRGHTLVISGPVETAGAARLAAMTALRSGSGLVTVAASSEQLMAHASHLTSVMLRRADSISDMDAILEDCRINCVVLGPGLPPHQKTADLVQVVLSFKRLAVLDAGALSCFVDDPEILYEAIKKNGRDVVLTPHEGEFVRLFPYESCSPSKIERARQAASSSGAIIVLKGSDTVIASPDGRISVSSNAPPWLATAGSGDVLAGMVAGLLAQGMPAFEAACAANWFHGEAANILGPAMISSDLDEGLRLVLKNFIEEQAKDIPG